MSGEDIMQELRILGVADVAEAIAFRRLYKAVFGIEKSLEDILKYQSIETRTGESGKRCG